ncbi:class I SAM-dependent methyltransferase [Niveibacterium sp. SC-1]|uniref:class I SAM-dependent methyltransferase n=1 Tax=Niveibacterium sp. SC-1 TaxID=3135646 RepID=UPI00311EF569
MRKVQAAMTQNIYDDAGFFQNYSALPRSREGLAGAPEWPALRALVPDLRGRRVVDLGCGFGWFARWAREEGAASVLGLDVSRNMLTRARDMSTDEALHFEQADLEQLSLPQAGFDFAYSALALHYVEHITRVFAVLHRALTPGARLVFSVEHPAYTAPRAPDWIRDAAGRESWPLDGYLEEGPRVTDWLAPGVMKQHRTLGTWLNTLIDCGFAIRHVEEWGPTRAQVAARPEWARERERPMFLLIAAQR